MIIFLQTADAADMIATMSLEAAEEEKVVATVTTVTTIAAGDVSAHFYRSSMPCVLARRLGLLLSPLSPFLFSLYPEFFVSSCFTGGGGYRDDYRGGGGGGGDRSYDRGGYDDRRGGRY